MIWTQLFFFFILNSLRHCGAANQVENIGTAWGAEVADIKKWRMLFNSSVEMSASWFLVSMYRIKINSVKVGICFRMFDQGVVDKFLRGSIIFGFVGLVWWGVKYLSHWIPKSESWNSYVKWVKLKSVSCTSIFLAKRVTSEKILLMLTSSFPGLLQNQDLETTLICSVLCFPPNNIASIHMCDECMKSIDSGVCHKLWSTSLPHEQVCLKTKEYQVSQYVPNTYISEQIVSKQ